MTWSPRVARISTARRCARRPSARLPSPCLPSTLSAPKPPSLAQRCRKARRNLLRAGLGGGALPGPRRVAIGVATLARHEIVAFRFEKLRRRHGSRKGTSPSPALHIVTRNSGLPRPTSIGSEGSFPLGARELDGGGGSLRGPVSSGELLNAGNHNLVAG